MATVTEQFPLTLDDLSDALYVGAIKDILFDCDTGTTTIEAIRHEVYNFERFDSVYKTYLEYFNPTADEPKPMSREAYKAHLEQTEVQPRVEQYTRGAAILEVNKIVSSGRTTVIGDRHYDEMAEGETIVSPAMTCQAGYIAMSPAYYYVALARRKSARRTEVK